MDLILSLKFKTVTNETTFLVVLNISKWGKDYRCVEASHENVSKKPEDGSDDAATPPELGHSSVEVNIATQDSKVRLALFQNTVKVKNL